MPRFAANLSMLYPELEFLDRFAAAATRRLRGRRVPLSLRLIPRRPCASGSTTTACSRCCSTRCRATSRAGERGLACLPGRQAEFLAGVDRAIEYARVLGCPRLHAMAGLMPARRQAEPCCAPPTSRTSPRPPSRCGRRARPADRADQHPRHPRLLPQHAGRRAPARRRRRRRQPEGADGPLSLPDRRRRPGDADQAAPAAASATSRSPACPSGTSRTWARSTIRTCSSCSTTLGYDGWIGCEYRPRGGSTPRGDAGRPGGWLTSLAGRPSGRSPDRRDVDGTVHADARSRCRCSAAARSATTMRSATTGC